MHPADIKAELAKCGYTQAKLAEELECTGAAVSNAIHRREKSRRICIAISNRIGLPLVQVFPDWYGKKAA